jgi:lipid-A-disaccharide synthase
LKLLLVAGEASGDLHAANLLAALRQLTDGVIAFGVGGERLRAVGLECLARSEELSVMGIAEVARELPRLLTLARRVRREALERRPDLAVLVDSPDFNLPLARRLRAAGIPVVIYISPQLWAWRAGRVKQIRRDVRHVLCILPFEVDYFAAHGVSATYVGHPLVDELWPVMSAPPPVAPRSLALLPGSRWHEVSSLLPEMLGAVQRLRADGGELRARLIVAPGLAPQRLKALLGAAADSVEIVDTDRHTALASSAAALVASGTATLECALLGVPMVVGYRLHALTYRVAKWLVKIPDFSLVNLTAGRRAVPELVQSEFAAPALARHVESLWGADGDRQRGVLAEVRRRLGPPGASERAARAALAILRGETPLR